MQIAEQIAPGGIVAGTEFMDAITDLVASGKLTRIIETGTYQGTGTTKAVIDGLMEHKLPSIFISIECNPINYAIAVRNNRGKPVKLLKGLSIPRYLLPKKEDIRFDDYPDSCIVDHSEETRQQKYYDETNHKGADSLIDVALRMTNPYPELVILDSAGYIGTIEFAYLMQRIKGPFYLALDDTNHVKHAKTVKLIETDNRFTLTFSSAQKFGSRIYQVQTD